uniref:Uncharacterized protein n=1 Tax=Anguilla anguilla TaxID=7936 RepID=A0A0E9V5S6_ANGAN
MSFSSMSSYVTVSSQCISAKKSKLQAHCPDASTPRAWPGR